MRENITQKQKDWKQQRLRDYLARRRKGLIIDLSKENIFACYAPINVKPLGGGEAGQRRGI